jgi:hypothetical protein
MPNKGTPAEGLAEIARRVFSGPAYSLIAYTNAQGSLGPTTVYANLTQPSQVNGYAPIVLNGTWSFTAGVAAYTHPAGASNDGFGNACWYASGAWSGAVTGAALVYAGIIQHFMDLVDGNGALTTFTAAAGGKLAVSVPSLVSSPG